MIGILDTTVNLHLFRKHPPALQWLNTANRYGITTTSWLEVMEGTSNKTHQADCKKLLGQFDLLYPNTLGQDWAMLQLEKYQFSHHIGKDDCLIASVAYRLQLPLYTHNIKDVKPLIANLAVKPYP